MINSIKALGGNKIVNVKRDAYLLECWRRVNSTTHSRINLTNFSRNKIANAAAFSFLSVVGVG